MKILYIAGRYDPRDHHQGSGVDYEFYQSLVRIGADVEIAGPFHFEFSKIEKLMIRSHNIFFSTRLFKYPLAYFIKSGKVVNQAIKAVDPDLIVSQFSAQLLFAQIDRPFLYMCDATTKWLKGDWKAHSNFALFSMSIWESMVIKKSHSIITFSKSNADVLVKNYKIPLSRITTFAIPSSIPSSVIPKNNEKNGKLNPVKLLLVGRDYYRKGVDIAIEIVKKLNQEGISAELRIVGLSGEEQTAVKFMGLYNKTIDTELVGYIENYQWADFLLHPARFEAAGIVPSEAAAFGVPTITNNVGGLGTTVEDNVSGVVLPANSPPDGYVEKIIYFLNHPETYWDLVKKTRDRYESELNWQSRDKIISQAVEKTIRIYQNEYTGNR